MNTREKYNLKRWKELRNGKNPTYLDILKHQSRIFYFVTLISILIAIYIANEFGVLSAPFGVLVGGFATFMGFLESKRKNLKIEVKYLDWSKIDNIDE